MVMIVVSKLPNCIYRASYMMVVFHMRKCVLNKAKNINSIGVPL